MATRRTFIQIAACTALPGAAGVSQASDTAAVRVPAKASPAIAPHAVIVEEQLAVSRTFGNRFSMHGIKVLSIREGDITAQWLSAIRPEWAKRRSAIAGLTSPAALFCLEQLAWPQGLRVVFHAEHILLPDGHLEHHVQRDAQMARLTASNLQRAGARWPTRLADAMAARSAASGRRPGPSLAALQPALPDGAQLLTSWIIAAA